jgi:hypothetical protein
VSPKSRTPATREQGTVTTLFHFSIFPFFLMPFFRWGVGGGGEGVCRGGRVRCCCAACISRAVGSGKLRCKSMPPSPKIPIAPGTRLDGITKPARAKFHVKTERGWVLPKPRCPHVKLGGGLCGLTPTHCRCICMLCQAPMCARQVCNARRDDGRVCTWGALHEPGADVTDAPAASPEGSKMMGRILFGSQSIGIRNLCLPNLEPGGPSYVGGVSLSVTPKLRERTPNKFKSPERTPNKFKSPERTPNKFKSPERTPNKFPMWDPSMFDITPPGSPQKPHPHPLIPRAWQP